MWSCKTHKCYKKLNPSVNYSENMYVCNAHVPYVILMLSFPFIHSIYTVCIFFQGTNETYKNKKYLWNMYAPPTDSLFNIQCHFDLDLWPRNPKFNRGHLLVMTNLHTKFEDPKSMSSLVIDRTRYVYGLTDLPMDRLTSAKQYTPSSRRGHNYIKITCHFYQFFLLVSSVKFFINK